MTEIRILPIFNQAVPGVWDDMLRIRVATMQYNYNVKLTDQEILDAMAEFQKSWKRLSFNFAFGAYDGGRMVGCISGDVQNKTAFIRHLYVLPEYQGQHIGARLLNEAEVATSVGARQTDIIALALAEKFYCHLGYTSPMKTNNYFKGLKVPKCRVVPMFHCAPSFQRACNALCFSKYDMPTARQINDEHLPTFVDYDVNSNVRAIGVLNNGVSMVKANSAWAAENMQRVLARFVARQK